MTRGGLVAGVMLAALAGPLAGQQWLRVEPGERVRIRPAPRRATIEGVVTAIRGDTIELGLNESGYRTLVPVSPLGTVDALVGEKSGLGHGVAVGGILGVVAGGLVGTFAGKSCVGNKYLCLQTKNVAVPRALAITAAGAATGAVIGGLSTRRIWARRVPPPIRVAVGPAPGGLAVSGAFSLGGR